MVVSKELSTGTIISPLFAHGGDAVARDHNLVSYHYAGDIGLPRLQKKVINPFEGTLEDITYREAAKKVGVDSDGVLNERSRGRQLRLGGLVFRPQSRPTTNFEYEGIFTDMMSLLHGRYEKGPAIIKIGTHSFIQLDDFMRAMSLIKADHQYKSNTTTLRARDHRTGEEVGPDPRIAEMAVAFDDSRYRQITPDAASQYKQALTLRANMRDFRRRVLLRELGSYGIAHRGLAGQVSHPVKLSDGSAAELVFAPQAHDEYNGTADRRDRKVYSGLFAHRRRDLSAHTGDLVITSSLAYHPPYQKFEDGKGLEVRTTKGEKTDHIHIMRIDGRKPLKYTLLK